MLNLNKARDLAREFFFYGVHHNGLYTCAIYNENSLLLTAKGEGGERMRMKEGAKKIEKRRESREKNYKEKRKREGKRRNEGGSKENKEKKKKDSGRKRKGEGERAKSRRT